MSSALSTNLRRNSKLSIALVISTILVIQSLVLPPAYAINSSQAATLLDQCIAAINDPAYTRSTLPGILTYSSPYYGSASQRVSYSTATDIENAMVAGTLTVWVASGAGTFGGAQNSGAMDIFCGDSNNNTVSVLDAAAGQRDIFFGGGGNDTVNQMWESVFYGGPGDDRVTGTFSEYAFFYGGSGTDYMDVAGVPASGVAAADRSIWYQDSNLSAPGAPTIGTATVVSPTSMTISFTAPGSNGGATIETYTATSSPGSITGRIYQAGSGSITVTGLTPSTSYTFTVTASNSVGTSSSSSASSAVSTPAATYTVTYDANTGSVESASATFAYGGSTTLLTPTKTGYTFQGWYDTTTAGTKIGDAGATYNTAQSRTLYARWLINSYTVTYNANTGNLDTASVTFNYGGSTTLLTPTKVGNTFQGWYDTTTAGTKIGDAGATYNTALSQTLYAQWSPNTYTISYNPNTGSVDPATSSFVYGGSTALLTPTKTGYTFQGWYDTTTAGTKIGDAGATYNTALSRTLYAQWLVDTYTYTYAGNGGSVDTSTVTFTFGDSPITLRTPTRTSYQFNGWYTADTGGTRIGGAAESHTPTMTRNLYAQWTQLSLVGLGTATKINSNTTSAGVGTSFEASSSGTNVRITYIADALPAGTVIDAYLLANTTRAAGLISDSSNLVLSLVVAWKATDGTVPSTATGSPISMTITNAAIKSGAKIYSLIGDTVTLLGTATSDGSATATFSDDPEIVIANPAVVTTPSGGGGSSGGGSSGGGSSGGGSSSPAVVTTTPEVTATTTTTTSTTTDVTTTSAATTSAPTTANATSQALTPTAPTAPIPSGQAVLDIRDASGAVVTSTKSVTISPVDPNVLVVSLPSAQVQVNLSSTSPNGAINPIQNTTLTIIRGSEIKISAEGFLPNSEVSVYVFSSPILLGTVKTDAQGKYVSTLASPATLEIGAHTIQLVGFLKDSSEAKISVPMVVLQTSASKTFKVYFAMNSAKISSAQLKALKTAIAKLDKKKITSIAIKGFAQKTAKQKNDDKLIQLRASNVAKALKSLGITTKSTISAGGYATEKDERARRVEITIKESR